MNKNRLIYYNKSGLYPDSALQFYKNMANDEMIYHIYSQRYHANSVTKKKILDASWDQNKSQLDSCILQWSPSLKKKVIDALKLFSDCCDPIVYHKVMHMNIDVYLVCANGNLEFGYPHTNSNYVFLPEKMLVSSSKSALARVLFHELIHIFQRFTKDTKFIDRYCKHLGYIKVGHIHLYSCRFKNHIVIRNPDTHEHGIYFYIHPLKKDNKIYFFLLYFNHDTLHIDRKTYLFHKNRWVEVDFIPETFPGVTQYEHPFEVMACHWSAKYFVEKSVRCP